MSDPRISVVTVCFNSAATIGDTLASVANQRGVHFEHVVVDGASSDATMEIVTGFTPEVARVISEPDRGLYDAMNKGMAVATGDILGYLNSDDVYADDDVLQKVAKAFADGNIDACYGDLVYVQQDTSRKWCVTGVRAPTRRGSSSAAGCPRIRRFSYGGRFSRSWVDSTSTIVTTRIST